MCQQVNKVCLLYLKACKQKLGPGQTHKYLATVTQCSEIPRADCITPSLSQSLNTPRTFPYYLTRAKIHVSTIQPRKQNTQKQKNVINDKLK